MTVASMETVLAIALSPKTLIPDTKDPIANPIASTLDTATFLLLERVLCIYYPLYFKKDTNNIKALINSNSEINAMTPAYAKKLGLWIRKTNINAQKIDESSLTTYRMVIASF